jgi:hypothetical protein
MSTIQVVQRQVRAPGRDDCLRRVAAAVRAAVDACTDSLVARYGGEMIALVTSHDEQSAGDIAQRIVDQVAALAIRTRHHWNASMSASVSAPSLTSRHGGDVRAHRAANRPCALQRQAPVATAALRWTRRQRPPEPAMLSAATEVIVALAALLGLLGKALFHQRLAGLLLGFLLAVHSLLISSS